MVDTENAHRRTRRRRKVSRGTLSEDANRLLNDPAMTHAFDTIRDSMIREIEELRHDGQQATVDYEMELCRVLRTLSSLKRALALSTQVDQLRLADFQPVKEE